MPGVLVLAAVLVGVTGWLVGHVALEQQLLTSQADDDLAGRVADAAADAAAMALGTVTDWKVMPTIALPLGCSPGTLAQVPLDVAAEQYALQTWTNGFSRWGVDAPQWRVVWHCHGEAILGRWPGQRFVPQVVVWVADEPEGDGQPLNSTSERLLLHAVARGPNGIRASRTVTVARSAPGAPVVLEASRRSTS